MSAHDLVEQALAMVADAAVEGREVRAWRCGPRMLAELRTRRDRDGRGPLDTTAGGPPEFLGLPVLPIDGPADHLSLEVSDAGH